LYGGLDARAWWQQGGGSAEQKARHELEDVQCKSHEDEQEAHTRPYAKEQQDSSSGGHAKR